MSMLLHISETLRWTVFDVSIDVMCDTSQINEAQLNRETICFLREKQSLKSEE